MKAILVIDIPNGYGDSYDNKCVVTLRNDKLGTSLRIYNVPLRPLPQKISWGHTADYIYGYKDCLDEIMGETE